MKILKLLIAPLLVLSALSPVSSAEIEMTDNPNSQARPIINVIFSDYLKSLTGVQVQSGITDLDVDGKGEIVARFIHSSSCRTGMKSCRTVVLRHSGSDWKIILDRFAEKLDFSTGYRNVPAPIEVDNTKWTWKNGRYLPTISTLGDPVSFNLVSAEAMASYAPGFGIRTPRLSNGFGVRYLVAQEGISDMNDIMVVKMDGNVVCGKISGCPIRILKRNNKGWSPILSTATTGDIRTSKVSRDGRRDIILETTDGALQLGWTGSTYALADRIEGVQ